MFPTENKPWPETVALMMAALKHFFCFVFGGKVALEEGRVGGWGYVEYLFGLVDHTEKGGEGISVDLLVGALLARFCSFGNWSVE